MSIRFSHLISVVAFCCMLSPEQSFAFDEIIGVPSVIDADTLEIHGTHIRLHGVDAPETRQLCKLDGKPYRCGQKAALALDQLISSSSLHCKGDKTDRYKRLIAVCYLKDQDINAWLVENGWALAYRKYSTDYVAQEASAETNHRGIWRGEFEAPWDFRKRSKHKR